MAGSGALQDCECETVGANVIHYHSDGEVVTIPMDAHTLWMKDCFQAWPSITWADIYSYLVESKACDKLSMKAFRSLDSYNYAANGCVGTVYAKKTNHGCVLSARVSPSQAGASTPDYEAWVAANNDGTIITALCSCPAGLGRACSHAAAIMFCVYFAWQKGLTGTSVTEEAVSWGKGSVKEILPSQLLDIRFKRKTGIAELDEVTCVKSLRLPVQTYSHDDFKEHIASSNLETLAVPGSLLSKIMNTVIPSQIPINRPILVDIAHGNHDIGFSDPVIELECVPCNEFYKKFIVITPETGFKISCVTKAQSNVVWQDARKIRITASRSAKVPKTQRGDPMKFIKDTLFPSFKGNSATKHGSESEDTARKDFQCLTDCIVRKQGLVISEKDPWLAGSPDGIIIPDTLLEIKCPVKDINELVHSGKYDVCEDGEIYILKENGKNGYYYQVQIGMYCLGFKECKFFVWSSKVSNVTVHVPIDVKFLEKHLIRLRQFFFMHFLPEVVKCFHQGSLNLSDRYKKLLSK